MPGAVGRPMTPCFSLRHRCSASLALAGLGLLAPSLACDPRSRLCEEEVLLVVNEDPTQVVSRHRGRFDPRGVLLEEETRSEAPGVPAFLLSRTLRYRTDGSLAVIDERSGTGALSPERIVKLDDDGAVVEERWGLCDREVLLQRNTPLPDGGRREEHWGPPLGTAPGCELTSYTVADLDKNGTLLSSRTTDLTTGEEIFSLEATLDGLGRPIEETAWSGDELAFKGTWAYPDGREVVYTRVRPEPGSAPFVHRSVRDGHGLTTETWDHDADGTVDLTLRTWRKEGSERVEEERAGVVLSVEELQRGPDGVFRSASGWRAHPDGRREEGWTTYSPEAGLWLHEWHVEDAGGIVTDWGRDTSTFVPGTLHPLKRTSAGQASATDEAWSTSTTYVRAPSGEVELLLLDEDGDGTTDHSLRVMREAPCYRRAPWPW